MDKVVGIEPERGGGCTYLPTALTGLSGCRQAQIHHPTVLWQDIKTD